MSNFPDPRIPKFESGKTLEDQLRAKKLNDFVAYVVSQTPIAGNGVTIQSSNQGRIISAPIRTIAYAGANNPYAMGNAQYGSNPAAVDTGGNYTGGGGTLGQWGGVSDAGYTGGQEVIATGGRITAGKRCFSKRYIWVATLPIAPVIAVVKKFQKITPLKYSTTNGTVPEDIRRNREKTSQNTRVCRSGFSTAQ